MHSKTILTLAALSAALLLPAPGACAQENRDNAGAAGGTTPSDTAGAPGAAGETSPGAAGETSPGAAGAGDANRDAAPGDAGRSPGDAGRSMNGGTAGGGMDVGQFGDALRSLRDLFNDMREARRLALAAQDPLIRSQFMERNDHLGHRALGVLDQITRSWKRSDVVGIRTMAGDRPGMRGVETERMGTTDMQRYAAESEDVAFVRNIVWQLQSRLQADKLNGRRPVITDDMMSLLEAAVHRAENPTPRPTRTSFRGRSTLESSGRVGGSEADRAETSRSESTVRTEESTTRTEETAPAEEAVRTESTTRTEETTTAREAAPPAEETATERTEERTTDVTTTPPAEETAPAEAAPEEAPAAPASGELPQTGGAPALLVLLGSSLIGAGAFLRR